MLSKVTTFILSMLFVQLISAEPVVLGRETNTVPTDSYRLYFKQTLAGSGQSPDTVKKQAVPDSSEFLLQRRFLPIHTPSLTPGTVAAVEGIKHAGNHPLCIVGADALSLEWIQHVKPRLIELGARCQVVEVESEQSLAVLAKVLSPLPWMLASGEYLAEQHGIRHYPVLISRQGVEQ